MQTLIKKNQPQTFANLKVVIAELQEWLDELEFWHLESDHFIRLLKRKSLYSASSRSGMRYKFQVFLEERTDPFKKELKKCLQNCENQEKHSMEPIVDLNKNLETLQKWHLQLQRKYRQLKIKALADLIKSYPIVIY